MTVRYFLASVVAEVEAGVPGGGHVPLVVHEDAVELVVAVLLGQGVAQLELDRALDRIVHLDLINVEFKVNRCLVSYT